MVLPWKGKFDRLYIGGEWVAPSGAERIDVISPAHEQPVASVPSSTSVDVDRAVNAARHAFDHDPWPHTGVAERVAVLQRLRDLIEQHREALAQTITEEMGCPISQSRTVQVDAPLALLDAYVEAARSHPFQSRRTSASGNALVTREPVGVVAAVVPWNVPITVSLQKLAPALLAGCTVVLKPAPETPLSAYLLAELLQEAGLPPGVVNIVPADREASESLVTHTSVDKVTFTGSTAAGRRIAALCGQHLKRVTLEMGGKSAAIVLDDADLATCVASLRMGSLRNSGQICSLKTRLVVSRRRHDEFVDRMRELLQSMPVSDPLAPETEIGPMVTSRQRDIVEDYIRIGRAEGADPVVGGERPAEPTRGWFVEPTLFTGARPDMRIAQEEIFGPVLTVLTYDNEEEAVALANDSSYGLNGSVFTGDVEHGLALARRIRTGTVEVNGSPAGFHAPMGGFKCSGVGREGGYEGLEGYLEPKSYGLPQGFASALH